ncbi:hypothetical protein CHU92_01890 [Flavobacterium cyanobacteriorum]|uniref:RNA polymerase sigma factor n=1 Tax=Flavobacterium cyanobacteriorum TaxID=2022802 RepID=A0A255ZXI5_9FLAO|nr:RNA polymerase sigma factor [Flavobacterium cyanobacteriorum]OYQ45604.1 hypothetical protein CHU92_01890 [Flavobacterium cyanobacteriorum]
MKIEDIYHRYKNLVFNLALQYSHNIEDAEEITQDVFVKVFLKKDTFNNYADFKTWIYRVTINQSLDFLKSKHNRKRHLLDSLFGAGKAGTGLQYSNFNHPGTEYENQEALQTLMKKISRLPENQKTVIILLKIEDLSQKQVANIMNISESAVESLFQRAKANLKKML